MLVAPLAIRIMGGLLVATFLTLLYLRGLCALWGRARASKKVVRASILILRRNIMVARSPHFHLPWPRNN